VNDFRHVHSDGPKPPKGHGTHHYDFRLAALNVARLELPALASVEEVWAAAQPPIVAEAELVGIYERRWTFMWRIQTGLMPARCSLQPRPSRLQDGR
jgi:hypothetical protein